MFLSYGILSSLFFGGIAIIRTFWLFCFVSFSFFAWTVQAFLKTFLYVSCERLKWKNVCVVAAKPGHKMLSQYHPIVNVNHRQRYALLQSFQVIKQEKKEEQQEKERERGRKKPKRWKSVLNMCTNRTSFQRFRHFMALSFVYVRVRYASE